MRQIRCAIIPGKERSTPPGRTVFRVPLLGLQSYANTKRSAKTASVVDRVGATAAGGDDVQVIPVGAVAAPGAVIVAPGANGTTDRESAGDDIFHNIIAGNLANIVPATEWAMAAPRSADILNMSIGEAYSDLTLDVSDKYVDHLVFEHFVAVSVAAGNECGDGKMIEPLERIPFLRSTRRGL